MSGFMSGLDTRCLAPALPRPVREASRGRRVAPAPAEQPIAEIDSRESLSVPALAGHDFSRMRVDSNEVRRERRLPGMRREGIPLKLNVSGDEKTQAPVTGAEPVALDDAKKDGQDKAGCGEEITWSPVSPVPTDIIANSAVEFANKVDAALAGDPHTSVSISTNPTQAGGKMTRVGLTVESAIIRPRWAGGRVSDKERDLIRRVEKFIKEHEERHRDLSRSVMQQAVCDALNQPVAKAQGILQKAVCDKEPTAQEDLDNSEGKLVWKKDSTGAVVDFEAGPEKHNYHEKGCKL